MSSLRGDTGGAGNIGVGVDLYVRGEVGLVGGGAETGSSNALALLSLSFSLTSRRRRLSVSSFRSSTNSSSASPLAMRGRCFPSLRPADRSS